MRVLATVLFAGALAGCGIPKAQYTELETKYNDAVAQRDAAAAERDQVKQELDEVRAKNKKRVENFSAVYAELLKIEAKKLATVKIEDGRAVLQLDSDVLFAPGSATLSTAGVTNVTELSKALTAGTQAKFQVEGHTDNEPIKSKEFPTNWHLGADRAINVVAKMIEAGMPADRVSAASMSDTQPVGDNKAVEGKKQNRRIEIVWMPELSEMLPYKRMMKDVKEQMAAETAEKPADAPVAPAPAEEKK
ncbi:MAG: flagellar motor protein MotB [Myxococcota bacterium]